MSIDFSTMDGYQFEMVICDLFRKLGFQVETTNYSNDGGIDLVATCSKPIFSGKYIIQCKNWQGSVGQPEVRDLYGVVMDQRANKGILVTPSDYTKQAYEFADGKNIELINGTILKEIIEENVQNTSSMVAASENIAYRNDRYFYYKKAIADEPNVELNYLNIIEYLRGCVKDRNEEICSPELFEEIITWSDKLINRCFKTTSKEDDRIAATMLKVEALIHMGRLAEATEELLKCNRFWIYGFDGVSWNLYDDSVKIRWCGSVGSLQAWNLYVAFKYINYTNGCELLISKLRSSRIFSGSIKINDSSVPLTTAMMENKFIYPTPDMRTNGKGKNKHLDISVFYPKDIQDPTFYYQKFYKKTFEQYAQEIDGVFKLHGIM